MKKSFAQEVKEEIIKNFKPAECCPAAYFSARMLKTGAAPLFADKKECCQKSFVTGAFLETGTVSVASVYHLEFVLQREETAADIIRILAHFGVTAKITRRGAAFVVYLKDSEAISDLLALLGASVAVLTLQNLKISRGIRGRENRATNCITANIDKTVDAAARQTEAIAYLKEHGGLSQLPPRLREAAEIRLAHREESAEELTGYFSPPLTKSGVVHRLNKIIELANERREQQ